MNHLKLLTGTTIPLNKVHNRKSHPQEISITPTKPNHIDSFSLFSYHSNVPTSSGKRWATLFVFSNPWIKINSQSVSKKPPPQTTKLISLTPPTKFLDDSSLTYITDDGRWVSNGISSLRNAELWAFNTGFLLSRQRIYFRAFRILPVKVSDKIFFEAQASHTVSWILMIKFLIRLLEKIIWIFLWEMLFSRSSG